MGSNERIGADVLPWTSAAPLSPPVSTTGAAASVVAGIPGLRPCRLGLFGGAPVDAFAAAERNAKHLQEATDAQVAARVAEVEAERSAAKAERRAERFRFALSNLTKETKRVAIVIRIVEICIQCLIMSTTW